MKLVLLHIISFSLVFSASSNMNSIKKLAEPIAVIVHESVDTAPIDNEDLLDIYTLSMQRWDDNTRIRVADYKGSQEIRLQFYDVLDTTPNNIKRIWLRAQFTGRSIPPKTVSTINEMLELVRNNPGTIGYIPLSQVPPDVIILLEIDE